MNLLISNVQRFSLHDGPGIRTTVFFMGCPLRCPWCCNPENLTKEIKKYKDINGEEKVYGKEYTIDELEQLILKDFDYYSDNGGVTYSGGEPLLQLKEGKELLVRMKERGISQCIETSLSVPIELLEPIVDYIDIFYVDLKIMDEKKYEEKLKRAFIYFKNNLDFLHSKNKKICFRVPIVDNFTNNEENLKKVKEYILKYSNEKATVFSVHNMGKIKYQNLNIPYKEFSPIPKEQIEKIEKYLNE